MVELLPQMTISSSNQSMIDKYEKAMFLSKQNLRILSYYIIRRIKNGFVSAGVDSTGKECILLDDLEYCVGMRSATLSK